MTSIFTLIINALFLYLVYLLIKGFIAGCKKLFS